MHDLYGFQLFRCPGAGYFLVYVAKLTADRVRVSKIHEEME